MHTLVVCQDSQCRTGVNPADIKALLAVPDNVIWLDLTDPTDEEILILSEQFGFHPLAIEDAIRAHERPKVDLFGESYYFLIFYAARYEPRSAEIELQALSLFVGVNFLVSIHRGACKEVSTAMSLWQLPNSPLTNRLSRLLHALLDAVVDEYFPLMDQIGDEIEDLEDAIFAHFDDEAIQTIFNLKKQLLRFRHIVGPERDVLNVLLRREVPVFKAKDVMYLQDVYDHVVRVTDTVDTYRDLLSSALDSYLSLQSNKLNEIVKVLAIASIILMADSLIAGIYGMNFQKMPELGWGMGHLWALLLMAVVSIGLVAYFRRRKWF
jgi:magnesium transporter